MTGICQIWKRERYIFFKMKVMRAKNASIRTMSIWSDTDDIFFWLICVIFVAKNDVKVTSEYIYLHILKD